MTMPSTEVVHQVHLGDAEGNDAQLNQALAPIAEKLNATAPGTAGYRTTELLGLFRNGWSLVAWAGEQLASVVQSGIRRFTNHEAILIKATAEARVLEAQAEAIKTNADADAKVKKAEAKVKEADAKIKEAEAKAKLEHLKAMIIGREQLLEKLSRRMDWRVEMNDGVMTVVVVKSASDPGTPDEPTPEKKG
jgi:methionine-rich copper-binding protein CopC